MKNLKAFLILVAVASVCGCASRKVTVDYDTCSQRGEVDGVKLAECQKVELK